MGDIFSLSNLLAMACLHQKTQLRKNAKSFSHQKEKLTYTHKTLGSALPLVAISQYSPSVGDRSKRYAIITTCCTIYITICTIICHVGKLWHKFYKKLLHTSLTLVTINKLTINKRSLLPKQKCKFVKEHISTTCLTPNKFPRTDLPKSTSLKCICTGKGGIQKVYKKWILLKLMLCYYPNI